jgi:hypothetical protein
MAGHSIVQHMIWSLLSGLYTNFSNFKWIFNIQNPSQSFIQLSTINFISHLHLCYEIIKIMLLGEQIHLMHEHYNRDGSKQE